MSSRERLRSENLRRSDAETDGDYAVVAGAASVIGIVGGQVVVLNQTNPFFYQTFLSFFFCRSFISVF